ncbi:disulfide bond formation protein DsbA [Knoellia subterranea]|nr:disulfide bond formation protein DsbA [Knoellia subterranea]
MTSATPVTFHFDPTCPWAWMTSRWLGDEVAPHRELDITWEPMSLFYLNESRDIPDEYRDMLTAKQDLSGAVVAARLRDGDAVVKPLYDAIGNRLHPGGRQDVEQIITEAFEEAGVAPVTVEEIRSDAVQDELRALTRAVIDKVGEDVGTPTIDIDGAAFFGPVVTPAPKGQAALDLWDGSRLVAGVPGFYEIKRTRTAGPQFD